MPKFKVVAEKSERLWGWRLEIVDAKTVRIRAGRLVNWQKVIEDKRGWIEKNLVRARQPKSLKGLTKVEILGEKYQIDVTVGTRDSLVVFEDKKEIMIRAKKIEQRYLQKLMDKKMRPWALKLIRDRTKKLAAEHQIKIGEIKIKNQKTRFGSCSSQGNLNFNWQIIFFAEDKFEHVILHELTHILIKDHSPKFWGKLGEMDKNSKQNNHWLKTEGQKKFVI